MAGEKLQKAKEACIAIVKNLRPQDSLSLASYSTKVTNLLNQSNNKNEAIQAINNLQATGVTRTDLALNWFQQILPPETGIARIEFIPSENYSTIKTIGTLKYTGSYQEIKEINKEIDEDKLRWELNIYSDELNKTKDAHKTGDLLINMQVAATKIGKPDLAKTAASTYENLQKTGKLTPHQTTSLLRDTRKID